MPTSSRPRTKRVAFVDTFSRGRRTTYDMLLALRDAAWDVTAAEIARGGPSPAATHLRTEAVA